MKALLTVKDEVNVKISGLELTDRRYLSQRFKFEVPGARYIPSVRLGRWDGKQAFFQLGGSTYVNLLPDILTYLQKAGYDIELKDTRTYKTDFTFNKIEKDAFSHIKWPEGHVAAGQPIELRDYQVEILNGFFGDTQSIQEVSTGAGKTLVTAALSYSVQEHGRSIVIVPNKGLVKQTEADYINMGLDVGVYYGDRKEYNKTHTICTWQSLNNMFKNTKTGKAEVPIDEFIDGIVAVIVDEVHMAKAEVLKNLLTGAFAEVPIRWGLTGTVPKEDYARVSILCSLGPITNEVSAKSLQDKGVLAQCEVNVLQLRDYGAYTNYHAELKYLVTNKARMEFIAETIASIKETGNTLVLVDRIESGKLLKKILNEMFKDDPDQPEVVFISGQMKTDDRKEHYDEVRTAKSKVIVATYGVAAVGLDIPRIFNMVLLEPGKSFVRVIQSIGRGIRKAPDKDFVQIWDITSDLKYAKRHLTKRKKFYKEAEYPHKVHKINWR